MDEDTRDHGLQPLDPLMERWGLSNHDLVAASPGQLTHKQVQRARKGRRLTLHMMMKVTAVFNHAAAARLDPSIRSGFRPYLHRQLFNYAKGHRPDEADPNPVPGESA
jgi:hypothetical protein